MSTCPFNKVSALGCPFYRDRENKRYILHPENSALDDIIVDKVRILGKAVRIYKNIEDYPI